MAPGNIKTVRQDKTFTSTQLLSKTTKTDEAVIHRLRADARFIEGWMRGTYIVAGIFAIPTEILTVAEIQNNIPTLHAITKEAKRGWWPRGISGLYLFPFYLGNGFPPDVIQYVQKRQPYRYAVWHEPVLYDLSQNAVWMRSDYGNYGSAFFPLVFDLYRKAFGIIAQRIGKTAPNSINGALFRPTAV